MTFTGNGSIWDGTKRKLLCTFVNGTLETDSQYVADKLISLGYTGVGELPSELNEPEPAPVYVLPKPIRKGAKK